MADATTVAQAKAALAVLGRREERLEDKLQDTRQARLRLKERRGLGKLVSLARIAAYTRAVKRQLRELNGVYGTEARLEKQLRALEKKASGVRGIAQEVLNLADEGYITFPLWLSTGGTARRDFVQLATRGQVRVPATGRVITPRGPQIDCVKGVRDAGLRAKRNRGVATCNALVGGVHRAGSLHYDLRGWDCREGDRNAVAGARENGGTFFDEDNTHEHLWFGTGGP